MIFLSNSSQHIYKLPLSLSCTHLHSFHVKICILKFPRKAQFLIQVGNAFPERLCPCRLASRGWRAEEEQNSSIQGNLALRKLCWTFLRTFVCSWGRGPFCLVLRVMALLYKHAPFQCESHFGSQKKADAQRTPSRAPCENVSPELRAWGRSTECRKWTLVKDLHAICVGKRCYVLYFTQVHCPFPG